MITTTQKVLSITGMDSSKTSLIDELIPMIENDYLAIRGKAFDVDEDDIVYPVGSELTAIKMIQYTVSTLKSQGVKSESIGDYSVTFDTMVGAYPESLINSIVRYATII